MLCGGGGSEHLETYGAEAAGVLLLSNRQQEASRKLRKANETIQAELHHSWRDIALKNSAMRNIESTQRKPLGWSN